MATNAPQTENPTKDPAAAAGEAGGPATTDEDILRLRSRLDREFALVTQKLADAEATILDVEISLRASETVSRSRLQAVSSAPSEKGTERITSRLKAMGDGFAKIKEWVVKPGAKEGDAPEPTRTGDIEDRLDDAIRAIGTEIRDRERATTELDRKLHEARKELIRLRTVEQEARDKQIKYNQTKELREQLERQLSQLNESVRTLETSTKTDTGIRPKPKDVPLAAKPEDPLQTVIDDSHKLMTAQEKKLGELEKEIERANTGLVEERARLLRLKAMHGRLRQARYFSTDLQRALSGLTSTLEDLRQRAGSLLRPDAKGSRDGAKPAARTPETPAEASVSKPS